jgi:glycogen debranching enzyme
LHGQAADLQARFNRDFWLPKQEFFALALEKRNKQISAVSSNPGQALWTGIVDKNKAASVVRQLIADDMFNGWGIRTLSSKACGYNPIGYHLGTVWPHDNALIASGFRRYGFDAEALKVFTGLIEAAMHFPAFRLPELFSGFARAEYQVPIPFPVACHPQAWAAGSILSLFETMLGLQANGFERQLRIVRPILPEFIEHLEFSGLKVADASVDLRFRRQSSGKVQVEIEKLHGKLEVEFDLEQ